MNEEFGRVLALKHAWAGVVEASDPVRSLAAQVAALDGTAPLSPADLDRWHRLVAAQAMAVMALRGLIEELQRRAI